jgi:hypothetical protein
MKVMSQLAIAEAEDAQRKIPMAVDLRIEASMTMIIL